MLGWIAMAFDTIIHVPLKFNCSDFVNTLVYDQKSAKLI